MDNQIYGIASDLVNAVAELVSIVREINPGAQFGHIEAFLENADGAIKEAKMADSLKEARW